MPASTDPSTRPQARSRRLPARHRSAAALLALIATAALSTGLALGAGGSPKLKSAHNSTLGENIVVDSGGRTLYALMPETRTHLLCTSSTCMAVWPPYTVPKNTKLKAGKGLKGKLALLKRSNGKYQVTLGGMPLYHFAPDGSTPGAAGGNGINSFGGHWHVIKASASTSSSPAPAPTTTTNTMPSYTPPGY